MLIRRTVSRSGRLHEEDKSGYQVWRYRIVALEPDGIQATEGREDQPPLEDARRKTPVRKTSTVSRVVRDTKKSRELKKRYDYTCQICSTRLVGLGGPYAEAALIGHWGLRTTVQTNSPI